MNDNINLKLNDASNIKFPRYVDWAIAIFLFVFLFASFDFNDTGAIIRHELDFAESIVNGEFKNFYKINQEHGIFAEANNLGIEYGHMCVYDFPVALLLGLWGTPLYIYLKYSGNVYTRTLGQIFYGKSLFLIAFAFTAILVYKILRALKLDEGRAKWGAFLYFTSTMAFNNVAIMGQLDSIGVAFTLLCVLNYIKGNNKWAFIWFIAAFPFKQLVTFIYLPLLLIREKNLFKIGAKLAAAAVFKMIYDLSERGETALHAMKSDFFYEHFLWLVRNKIPFISSEISIFVLLFGIICVYCYLKKESCDFDERNRNIILVSMTAIAVELNTGAGNLNWFLYLAPFMAMTVVIYGREIKNFLLFDFVAGITWMAYNYTHYRGIYGSKYAAKMLLSKFFTFPEIKSIDTLLQQGASDTTTVLMNAIYNKAGKLAQYIYGVEVMFGTLFIVCILTLIYLSRRENIGESEINIRPYALSRLFVNALIMYMPLFLFIYRALMHYNLF